MPHGMASRAAACVGPMREHFDPGILAWLLRDFPLQPLPQMQVPLSAEELENYRDELAERLRKHSLP
jgi:hypothetical protein